MRTATISRQTAETKIELSLNLDGTGVSQIATGCGFLDHMLTLLLPTAATICRLRATAIRMWTITTR